MKPGRNRWLLRVAIPLLVGLAVLVWALGTRGQHGLVVENRAGQPLARLEVTVGEQTKIIRDMPAGADVAVPISTKGASPVHVQAQLADGTLFRGQFREIPEGTRVVVLSRGIELRLPGKD
jgi:hypothetical protein